MNHSASEADREAAPPTVTLNDVDIRSELLARPHRPPNYETEGRALAALAKEIAENPKNLLQKLVETALDLCNADTAGISLLEGDVFRWEALAGVFAARRNNTMPRHASPCGVCIEQDTIQLMHLADRIFPALSAEPRFVEALLIPFHAHGRTIGTVWVVAHSFERHFDSEDARIIDTLAQFASAGWQLWQALEAAEEANRRKDEFLAMVSHELRSPLTSMFIWTGMLRRGALDPDQHASALTGLDRAIHLEANLVNDLLDLSRITAGQLTLQLAAVELSAIAAATVEAYRPHAAEKGVDLTLSIELDSCVLRADATRLQQVIGNLVSNAIKFTPPGGRVAIELRRVGSAAELRVRDSGIGIGPDFLPHVFDPFRQADTGPSLRSSGLGLGLAIVKRLVELQGGSVAAESEGEGRGATFTLTFPHRSRPVGPDMEGTKVPTMG